MRFVPIKSEEEQAALAVHRACVLLMRQHNKLMHALRAHMAEPGIIAETGLEGLAKLVNFVSDARSNGLLLQPMVAALSELIDQIMSLEQQIHELDRCIKEQYRASDVSKRLESIPGIGIMGATLA